MPDETLFPAQFMSDETLFPAQFMSDNGMTDDEWAELVVAADEMAHEAGMSVEDVLELSDPPGRVKWRVTDVGSASWAMAKLVEAEDGLADVHELADAWRSQINEWERATTKEERATAAFMRAQLTRWAVEQREAGGKATVPLIGGKLKTQDRKATAEIMDQDAVVSWAKASGHAELVQTKESVLVSKLREVVQVCDLTRESLVLLACGHQTTVKGKTARGEVTACSLCTLEEKPEDGDIMQPVVEVTSEIVESIVLPMVTDKPEPIPGTRVNPRRILPSIVLD